MSCSIYVIGPEFTNEGMKIGIGHDPYKRCRTLQTGHASKLKVYHSIKLDSREKAREAEKKAHIRLKPYKQEGEWFEISSDVAIQIIEECAFPEKHKQLKEIEKNTIREQLQKAYDVQDRKVNELSRKMDEAKKASDKASEEWKNAFILLMEIKDEIKKI